MAAMNDRRTMVWFLLIAFAISWALFLVPLAFGAPGSSAYQSVALIAWSAAMWGPGLAALIVTKRATGESLRRLHLSRLGPRLPYLWAWLVPVALSIVAGLFTVLLGAGRLDLTFPFFRQALAQTPGGGSVPIGLLVAAQAGFALTLAPLINIALTMGEELGWRGFLLPALLPLGQWRAILLSGAIWGIWHAPAIAQGHNYPGQPVLGILMMIVFCLLAGTVFSWLYLRTGSPWAPALAHGSLNATAGLPILFLATGVDMNIGGTIASPIGWIGMALFVAWLAWSRRVPVKEASSALASSAG